MKRLVLLSAIFVFCVVAASSVFAATTVTDLRCEHLTNPEGIDMLRPRLSWILNSNTRGQQQTAYQILVASSEKKLTEGKADLWDSGKIASDQSIELNYGGAALASTEPCFWKVRVWDMDGKASAWSNPAHWSKGLLEAGDWKGKWIGLDGEDVTNYLTGTSWIWSSAGAAESAMPATNCFRRVITIPAGRQIKRAFFQYTGDNDCWGSINDLNLGVRNNYRTVKYNDITTRIEPGKTYVFCLVGQTVHEGKPAGVVGLIQIEFATGEPMIIATDEHWKMFDHEVPGWDKPTFDDSSWASAKTLGPVGMQPWGDVRRGDDHRLAARWLRKEFPVEKKIERATVYFSGLGLSELYLNGKKAD
ncbi:MAG TPA: hypothetical protein VH255_01745, partial [Verrucomicrobiae bacterium]|nr:hypothetical protein [Verrucomicrobiae bacterium]